MRGYLCYAGMELKRALKRLPHILAGAAVLVVLMGAAALLAGKLLYGGQAVERIPVRWQGRPCVWSALWNVKKASAILPILRKKRPVKS